MLQANANGSGISAWANAVASCRQKPVPLTACRARRGFVERQGAVASQYRRVLLQRFAVPARVGDSWVRWPGRWGRKGSPRSPARKARFDEPRSAVTGDRISFDRTTPGEAPERG
jgi:hypothetical protein